jgi:hypothetical protein
MPHYLPLSKKTLSNEHTLPVLKALDFDTDTIFTRHNTKALLIPYSDESKIQSITEFGFKERHGRVRIYFNGHLIIDTTVHTDLRVENNFNKENIKIVLKPHSRGNDYKNDIAKISKYETNERPIEEIPDLSHQELLRRTLIRDIREYIKDRNHFHLFPKNHKERKLFLEKILGLISTEEMINEKSLKGFNDLYSEYGKGDFKTNCMNEILRRTDNLFKEFNQECQKKVSHKLN